MVDKEKLVTDIHATLSKHDPDASYAVVFFSEGQLLLFGTTTEKEDLITMMATGIAHIAPRSSERSFTKLQVDGGQVQ